MIRPSPTFSCQNPRQPATGINRALPRLFIVTMVQGQNPQVQVNLQIRRGGKTSIFRSPIFWVVARARRTGSLNSGLQGSRNWVTFIIMKCLSVMTGDALRLFLESPSQPTIGHINPLPKWLCCSCL